MGTRRPVQEVRAEAALAENKGWFLAMDEWLTCTELTESQPAEDMGLQGQAPGRLPGAPVGVGWPPASRA